MTNKSSKITKTEAYFSQITETVSMLRLAVAQIRMAMLEGDESVTTLTGIVTGMIDQVSDIHENAKKIPIEGESTRVKDTIIRDCMTVQSRIQDMVIAFQFYDKLSQRVHHVEHMLKDISDLVADPERLFKQEEWAKLQMGIRSRYSMKEEQQMFDALLNGESVETALERMREQLSIGDIDDIELF